MRGQLTILTGPMLGALAGCVAGGNAMPAPLPAKTTVSLQGAEYLVTTGTDLVLTRAQSGMQYDEGLTAKQVAEAHCASAGRSLNPSALGRFQAGSWVFPGGCA